MPNLASFESSALLGFTQSPLVARNRASEVSTLGLAALFVEEQIAEKAPLIAAHGGHADILSRMIEAELDARNSASIHGFAGPSPLMSLVTTRNQTAANYEALGGSFGWPPPIYDSGNGRISWSGGLQGVQWNFLEAAPENYLYDLGGAPVNPTPVLGRDGAFSVRAFAFWGHTTRLLAGVSLQSWIGVVCAGFAGARTPGYLVVIDVTDRYPAVAAADNIEKWMGLSGGFYGQPVVVGARRWILERGAFEFGPYAPDQSRVYLSVFLRDAVDQPLLNFLGAATAPQL